MEMRKSRHPKCWCPHDKSSYDVLSSALKRMKNRSLYNDDPDNPFCTSFLFESSPETEIEFLQRDSPQKIGRARVLLFSRRVSLKFPPPHASYYKFKMRNKEEKSRTRAILPLALARAVTLLTFFFYDPSHFFMRDVFHISKKEIKTT